MADPRADAFENLSILKQVCVWLPDDSETSSLHMVFSVHFDFESLSYLLSTMESRTMCAARPGNSCLHGTLKRTAVLLHHVRKWHVTIDDITSSHSQVPLH